MVLSQVRLYPVIPVTVKLLLLEPHCLEFPICHLDPLLIGVGIELGFYAQARPRSRAPNQVHYDRTTHQWPPPPVLGDVAENPVLDLVPLARPRREVTDGNPQTRLIGQTLQTDLPEPIAAAVAPPGIGRDQQLLGLRVDRTPHPNPPPPDRL